MSKNIEIEQAQVERLGAATGISEPAVDHSREDEKVTAGSILTVIVSLCNCEKNGNKEAHLVTFRPSSLSTWLICSKSTEQAFWDKLSLLT